MKIDIKLDGPICDCEKPRLSWGVDRPGTFVVECKTCGGEHRWTKGNFPFAITWPKPPQMGPSRKKALKKKKKAPYQADISGELTLSPRQS